MGSASTFDYASLKDLLKETNAEVLLPSDGAKYEKSIERWSEQSIKRAVSASPRLSQSSPFARMEDAHVLSFKCELHTTTLPGSQRSPRSNLVIWKKPVQH
jgi:hypothetical protein